MTKRLVGLLACWLGSFFPKEPTSQQANKPAVRGGYIFLLSVLVVGIISSTVVLTLVLLGLASIRSGFALQQSAKAFGYAEACAERALSELRADNAYEGGDTIVFADGTCETLLTGGIGNENRTVCAEGQVDSTVRRLEIVVDRLLPSTRVYSWQEVDIFTFCEYP